MCTSHQACLIKCILRPLKTLQRAHLSWLIKLPGRPVQLSVCLTCSLWLLASCSSSLISSSFTWSCTLGFASLCILIDFISFSIVMSGCSCVVHCIYSQVLLSDTVPLIFHRHTPAQSLKYLLLLLQTHHSLSPQSFSLLSWHMCMFVHSFQRTHACVSVHKQKSYAQGSINSTSIQCTSKCMTSRVEGELFPKGTSASFLFITLLRR